MRSRFGHGALIGVAIATAIACSSGSPRAIAPAGLTCARPGEVTPGPADTHCAGRPAQTVTASSCLGAAPAPVTDDAGADTEAGTSEGGSGDDGGGPAVSACVYGATMFRAAADGGSGPIEGDDDDCKYHVAWTSTPICPSAALGVTLTVTLTYLATGLPVTDLPPSQGLLPEAFIPTSLDAPCDTMTSHVSPTPFGSSHLFQTSDASGVYVGQVIFDQPGEWTLRFHLHEECTDVLADSPHGHAAFRITVP